MSKKHIRLSLFGIVLLAALFWVSPYWAMAGMAKAAQAGDAELLSDYIDLPRLKESFKGQAMAHMQSEMQKTTTNGWEALGMALGTVMIDKAIDNMLTPETIAKLLSQQLANLNVSRATLTARLIASNNSAWVNDDTFRLTVNEGSFMTWRRERLTWRLTSVTVPLDKK